jgi:hypothetical protein
MPFFARGRRALVALIAVGGLAATASSALAFPAPDITGGPTDGQRVADRQPNFTVDGGGNPVVWCFVSGSQSVNGSRFNDPCAGESDSGGGSSASPGGPLSDGTYTLIARTGPDDSDPFGPPYNGTSRSFEVDATGPELDLPLDLSVQATSDAGAAVDYDASAHDQGDSQDVPLTCLPASGSVFPIGNTLVTCGPVADSLGNASGPDSFTVTVRDDLTPPSVPSLSGPNPGAGLFNPKPTFGWQASDPTGHVQVARYEIAIDEAPQQVTAAATQYTPADAMNSGSHTWKVAAIDARGRKSAYSAPRSFFIIAPAAPAITAGPAELGNASRPFFSWSGEAGSSFQWVVRNGSDAVVLTGSPQWTPATEVTIPTPLPDGPYSLVVRQANVFGIPGAFSAPWTFAVETTAPRLVMSPVNGSNASSPSPGRSNVGTRTDIEVIFSEPVKPITAANLRLCVGLCGAPVEAVVKSGEAKATLDPEQPLRPATTYQVQLTGVTDLAGNPLELPSDGWTWTFRTAQSTPPPAPVTDLTLTPGLATVALAWTVPDGGTLGKIRVVRREGTAPTGPSDPAAVVFDLAPTARAHIDSTVTPKVHYFYALYSFDAFGNPAEAAATGDVTPLAPAEPPAPGPGTGNLPGTGGTPKGNVKPPTQVVRGLINPARLSPVRGLTLQTLRPLLKWKGIGKRARLYNVQIFLGSRKIVSAFPRTAAYRVPAGRLKPGKSYLWRVWPYVGRKYTKKPLGVSYFRTAARRIQAATPAAAAGSQ